MKIKTGVDIISIDRIKGVFEDNKKWKKMFSPKEIDYFKEFKDPYPTIAGRFAAKEAIYKALSHFNIDYEFNELSIITDRRTGMYIEIENENLRSVINKNYSIDISISHDSDYAVAFCIVYES